jgi:glycosyltransferase involved in cell wall biosynthesis
MPMKAIYAAFDLYPSSKGAATHMHYMIDTLYSQFGRVSVYALGNGRVPDDLLLEGIDYCHFNEVHANYLKRAEAFVDWLRARIDQRGVVELAHFRDIWSGMALLSDPRIIHTVFEVNGFPSIELPYRYPHLSSNVLNKLRELEYDSLVKSDLIICPSATIKKLIIEYGIEPEAVKVIPNGAAIMPSFDRPDGLPQRYLVYFGALQSWQGLDVLMKAYYQLRDFEDLHLVICSSQPEKYARHYRKLATKLGMENRVVWYYELDKTSLAAVIQHAELSIAPLRETARNIRQGCSPLKIFESMANRTTVVASDIPAVREIIDDRVNGRLVKPDRPAELARMIRFLLDNPDSNIALAENGYSKIKNEFQWGMIQQKLQDVYNCLIFV